MAVALVDVSSIAPHPENARVGAIDALEDLIRQNGWVGVLECQRSSRRILKGNNAYVAAVRVGYDRLPVEWLDVDDDEARVILAGDNRTSELAGDDPAGLVEVLRSLEAEAALAGSGFETIDVRRLATWDLVLPDGSPRSGGYVRWSKTLLAITLEEQAALLERIADYRHDHDGEREGFLSSLLARAEA